MSPACALAMDVLDACGSLTMLLWMVGGIFGEVVTNVCVILWIRLFDCWNSIAMAFIML